jgi:putative flippase GtrA
MFSGYCIVYMDMNLSAGLSGSPKIGFNRCETVGMVMVSRVITYVVAHFGELCRFGVVGVVTFGINFLLFSLFFGLLHADYRVAVSLAYVITVCCHFTLNKVFTFDATSDRLRQSAFRYGLLLGLNYTIALSTTWLTVAAIGASPYFGVIAATAGTATSSFFVMKYFVFGSSTVRFGSSTAS